MAWEYSPPLVSEKTWCDECSAPLTTATEKPAEVTVYTRAGTEFRQHVRKICSNHFCKKTFSYGYSLFNGRKRYDTISKDTKFLVTSHETAFSLDFMYEMTLHMVHCNSSFSGLCDVYNNLHGLDGSEVYRQVLHQKRLTSGFFLYSFLEMRRNPSHFSGKNLQGIEG